MSEQKMINALPGREFRRHGENKWHEFKEGDQVYIAECGHYVSSHLSSKKSTKVRRSHVCGKCLKRLDAAELKDNELTKPPVEVDQHDPNAFKVGDRVKVVKIVECRTGGWTHVWIDEMDRAVGGEYCVMGARGRDGFHLHLKDSNCYFPSQALELVESAESKGAIPVTYDPKALETAQADIERLKKYKKAAEYHGLAVSVESNGRVAFHDTTPLYAQRPRTTARQAERTAQA